MSAKADRLIVQMHARATIHRVQPGDIIVLGNIGAGTATSAGMGDALARIRDITGAAHVYAFEGPIDIKVISEREQRIRRWQNSELLWGSR